MVVLSCLVLALNHNLSIYTPNTAQVDAETVSTPGPVISLGVTNETANAIDVSPIRAAIEAWIHFRM